MMNPHVVKNEDHFAVDFLERSFHELDKAFTVQCIFVELESLLYLVGYCRDHTDMLFAPIQAQF